MVYVSLKRLKVNSPMKKMILQQFLETYSFCDIFNKKVNSKRTSLRLIF